MKYKTVVTVSVVFDGDETISEFDVHERLKDLIEQDALPMTFTTRLEDE